MSNETLAKQIY